MRLRHALLVAVAAQCAACSVHAADSAEVALVRKVFAELQPISIRNQRKYCGYLGYAADGKLVASPAVPGDEGTCEADDPDAIEVITASYHTHGAFSPDYHNEVPSVTDIEGDEEEGIDGYVATPGGRLWYVDTETMTVSQLCGIGCLPADPDFVAGDDGRIEQSYTYDALAEKLAD